VGKPFDVPAIDRLQARELDVGQAHAATGDRLQSVTEELSAELIVTDELPKRCLNSALTHALVSPKKLASKGKDRPSLSCPVVQVSHQAVDWARSCLFQ
jgi:hypothetical protein